MCPLVTEAMEVTPASSHLVPSPIPTAALLQRQSFGWYMSDRKELLGPRGVTQDRALCLRFTSRGHTVNKPNTCLWKVAGRGFWFIYFFRPYFKNQKLKKVLFFCILCTTVAFVQLLMNRTDVKCVMSNTWIDKSPKIFSTEKTTKFINLGKIFFSSIGRKCW